MLHRSCFAGDLATACAHRIAGRCRIVHLDGDVAVGVAQLILLGIPVVGQLNYGVVGLITVADEGEGKASFGIILFAQQLHVQYILVKRQGAFEIADAQHGVE